MSPTPLRDRRLPALPRYGVSVRSTPAAIVVSNVIGGGIFFVPILVAAHVPDDARLLCVWLPGGALSFAGAMAYAELAASGRKPAASTCTCAKLWPAGGVL